MQVVCHQSINFVSINLVPFTFKHYICGKLDPCVAHQVAGYVEIFYKARSLFYLTDIVVPNLLTMGLFKLALSEGCSKTKIHSHIGHEETKVSPCLYQQNW